MKYDFENAPSREGQGSTKWAAMRKANPGVPAGIVPLSVADMEFANPPQIARGVSDYLTECVLGYPSPTPGYLDAVCSWMDRRHGWHVDPSWIVDYPGVVPAIFHLCRLLAQPGEGVILLTPVYYPFYDAVRTSGRTLVDVPLVRGEDRRYGIDFQALEKAAADTRNTVLLLCSPANPVGRVWTKDELGRVADICLANGVTVVSDEIHADLVMPGHRHIPFASLSDEAAQHSVTCTAPSKTFNTAGLMTSNIIVPNVELRERLQAFRAEQAVFSCNILGYKACEVAYNECENWLEELLGVLDGNKRLVEEWAAGIDGIEVTPLEGTYLMWLDCRGLGMGAAELERFMTREALVFADEGYVFGPCGEGFERINIACPRAVLAAALDRWKAALERR